MNTYKISIEISEYVKDDQGFYVVWGTRESANGLQDLAKAFNRIKNGVGSFIIRNSVVDEN